MESFEDLAGYLALQTEPEETIQLTVLRDGEKRTVDVTLTARPKRSRTPLR